MTTYNQYCGTRYYRQNPITRETEYVFFRCKNHHECEFCLAGRVNEEKEELHQELAINPNLVCFTSSDTKLKAKLSRKGIPYKCYPVGTKHNVIVVDEDDVPDEIPNKKVFPVAGMSDNAFNTPERKRITSNKLWKEKYHPDEKEQPKPLYTVALHGYVCSDMEMLDEAFAYADDMMDDFVSHFLETLTIEDQETCERYLSEWYDYAGAYLSKNGVRYEMSPRMFTPIYEKKLE